jgi:ATP-dependent Clp protease protease subunit
MMTFQTLPRPPRIDASAAESPLVPSSDQLCQRLLQNRIVFLGQEVDDDISGRICSELLLLSAEDSRRDIYLYINSPGGSVTAGMATDVKIMAEQMLHTKRTLAERIAFHTGQPVEQIERDSDRDRWFTAEEAKEYGFVDHVVLGANQVAADGPLS